MKYLKKINEGFSSTSTYRSNYSDGSYGVLKVTKSTYGWNCNFTCKLGKGHALVIDNTSKITKIEMNNDEMYLFGIETIPSNSGVGKLFINSIFDYFNIYKLYLPSNENHPVWNKIATKTDIKVKDTELTIFTLTKKQLNK